MAWLKDIPQPKFEVGDSVTIMDNDRNPDYLKTTTIEHVEWEDGPRAWCYATELANGASDGWYDNEHLESNEGHRFKVDDTVTITNNESGYWNMVGSIHEVLENGHYIVYVNDYVTFSPDELQLTKPKTKTKSNKEHTMSRAKDQLNANKEAVITAGKLVAGKAINKKLIKLIKPKLPMFMKGYADSPFAALVSANLVGIAIKHYAPNNTKAIQVADLMLEAAALEAIESFNIEDLIDKLLKDVKLPKIEDED
jgi:hypothetical protein